MENKKIQICALVLHFRTPEKTLTCLNSLAVEGVRRAVLIDNSEDNGCSLQRMNSELADLEREGFRIDLVEPGVNLGFAAGVQQGIDRIAEGVGAHVLLINSDAKLVSGSLNAMLQTLDNAAVVMPPVRSENDCVLKSPVVFYHKLAGLYLRNPRKFTLAYPSGTCLLIRRDVISDDLFDQEFFFYGEDVEFGQTLIRRNVRFETCEKSSLVHSGSASAKNGSMFYEYHMNRAHWLLAEKLASSRKEYFLFVFVRCITLTARALVRSLRWRSFIPWKGLAAATHDVILGRCRSFTPPADL